jgi:hypothetical protein
VRWLRAAGHRIIWRRGRLVGEVGLYASANQAPPALDEAVLLAQQQDDKLQQLPP